MWILQTAGTLCESCRHQAHCVNPADSRHTVWILQTAGTLCESCRHQAHCVNPADSRHTVWILQTAGTLCESCRQQAHVSILQTAATLCRSCRSVQSCLHFKYISLGDTQKLKGTQKQELRVQYQISEVSSRSTSKKKARTMGLLSLSLIPCLARKITIQGVANTDLKPTAPYSNWYLQRHRAGRQNGITPQVAVNKIHAFLNGAHNSPCNSTVTRGQ